MILLWVLLFIIFITGYVRRLHDIGLRASPAAKVQIITFLFSCISCMYYGPWNENIINFILLAIPVVSLVVSLPMALLYKGTKGRNSFGDEPKDLLGVCTSDRDKK